MSLKKKSKKKSDRQKLIEELDRMNGLGRKREARRWTLQDYKDEAWALLSKIIRLQAADKDGLAYCVTCLADSGFADLRPWKELQAGHFQSGRTNSILFVEEGIFPQCVKCNFFNGGNRNAYIKFLNDRMGVKKAAALMARLYKLSKETVQFSIEQLEERIAGYKARLDKLKKEKSA